MAATTHVESSRAVEPIAESEPVGRKVAEVIAQRRAASEAYLAEAERLAEYEAIARLVILRRATLGLTQAQLGARMGTTASVISRVESGMRPTTIRTLRRLFMALDGRLLIGIEWGPETAPQRDWVAVS